MNAQQFLGWMRNPGQTAREDGAQLDALLDSFPYFQSGHLLYIKNLHNQGSFLYNNQLKTAAAYAVNRKVLYELITRKEEVQKAPVAVAATETVAPAETVTKSEEISAPPKFPAKRFVSNPDEWEAGMLRQLQLLHHWSTGPKTEPVREKEPEITIIPPVVNTPPEEIVTTESEVEIPGAQEEINTLLYVLVEPGEPEDLNEEYQEEISSAIPISEESSDDTKWEISPKEEQLEPVITHEPISHGDPVQQEILVEAIHSTFSLEVDDIIPSVEELQPNKVEETKATETAENIAETQEEVVVGGLEMSFSQWVSQVNKTVPSALPKTPLTGDTLIEQFIKDEPRIKVKKSGFFNPVNMAKKSVQESDEFITETLARIYAKQGNYHKAIRAYQKLSLKFPEKTPYFAALIEELKRTPDKPSQK